MRDIEITAKNFEEAVEEAMRRFQVPREAVNVVTTKDGYDDTLEGAEPLEIRVKIRLDKDYFTNLAQEYVQGLLKHMGLTAEVRTDVSGNIVKIHVSTNNNPVLIGKRGQNLEAVEHLINRMVNRGERELPYVVIDVEHYREKRYEKIESVARRAAQKAVRTGRDVLLKPMPPEDRKLVHNLLKSFRGVKTFSQGREGERHIIVSPEKSAPRPKRTK